MKTMILLALLMMAGCAPNPATYRSCDTHRLPVEVVVLMDGKPSGKTVNGMRAYFWEGYALDPVVAGSYRLISFEHKKPLYGDTLCMEFDEFGGAVERATKHLNEYHGISND